MEQREEAALAEKFAFGLEGEQPERAAFAHTPIPPRVAGGEHAWQRWFDGRTQERAVYPKRDPHGSEAQIFRDGTTDYAEVRLTVRHGASRFEAEMQFDPAALRELAHRLLDAAHDIEVHPAKELAL